MTKKPAVGIDLGTTYSTPALESSRTVKVVSKQKNRISAKNGLKLFCFKMKTIINDEKISTD